MFLFHTAPWCLPVDVHYCWRMVGSDAKLSYASVPQSIHGYSRLRWPFLILFVPRSCMKRCGRVGADNYDLLVHIEGEGNLYVELEDKRRVVVPSYEVLARILHALLEQRQYCIANVTYLNIRLIKPKPRRASLVCCGSSDRMSPDNDYDVAENLVNMGAGRDSSSSPVRSVRSECT